MDMRAAKLALARKKLKDHQEKKCSIVQSDDKYEISEINVQQNTTMQPVTKNEKQGTSPDINNQKQDTTKLCDTIQSDNIENLQTLESGVNITEILITNKRNLELQLCDLQSKLEELESSNTLAISNYNDSCQKIKNLESELKNIYDKYLNANEQLVSKDVIIEELNNMKSSLSEKNSNLVEQLEFTKSILTAKETENDSIHSQLYNLHNELDVAQLQLQQLSSGSHLSSDNKKINTHESEALLQKISNLEQQLKVLQKERDHITYHYENYVSDLNDRLKSVIKKNEDLNKEVQNLSNREISLIDQISDMEIRIQNYSRHKNVLDANQTTNMDLNDLQQNYENVQKKNQELSIKVDELQKLYSESKAQIQELTKLKEPDLAHDNISMLKLNADITSDKVAAQRATEQNKKLKHDIQGLEDAFVKMSKDKLELTEKITAEKYLNRELTIKLAEIEEKAKDMYIKLKAKDEEMIRLQTSCRIIEQKYEQLTEEMRHLEENTQTDNNENIFTQEDVTKPDNMEHVNNVMHSDHCHSDHGDLEHHNLLHDTTCDKSHRSIPKEDAMLKLQDRFLKIMDEVANLSDEKYRLEHIILQLQNETDTICEYVALYQQQRSLLKRRDEERNAQMKVFQSECDRLQSQLGELTAILVRFAEDKNLSSYFQIESNRTDIQKVMDLLLNLKNNSLVDPTKKILEFKNFYPCNCCSGKLIDV